MVIPINLRPGYVECFLLNFWNFLMLTYFNSFNIRPTGYNRGLEILILVCLTDLVLQRKENDPSH